MSTPQTTPDSVGFRISPQQEHLLSLDGRAALTQCAALLAGPIDEARLRAALEHAVSRHEILRTTFSRPPGMRVPQQVIHERADPAWTSESGDAAGLARDPAALDALLDREADGSLDLERGPLMRARFVRAQQDGEGLLILTVGACCADAHSLPLLLDELAGAYAGIGAGDEPLQYADYAEWRHEQLADQGPAAEEGRSFWREDAAERPPAPRVLFGRIGGAHAAERRLPALDLRGEGLVQLREAATSAGASTARFLEAAWHALIARLTGASQLLVAGYLDGRSQPDIERAIGGYEQPVPIRTRYEEETSFAELLDQVRRARGRVARVQDFAAAADLDALAADAGIGFSAIELPEARLPLAGLAALTRVAEPVAVILAVLSSEDRATAELRFDPAALSPRDADDLVRRLRTLLADATADPSRPVHGLAITEPEERGRILDAAGGPGPSEAARTPVHHLFEVQAARTPDHVAVSSSANSLSYAELNAAANRLARHLRGVVAAEGARIGLCMERTPSMLIALLGILKAGAAYLPLNHEHPQARLSHQLTEAGADVVVTEEHLLGRLEAFEGTVVCVDRDAKRISSQSAANPERAADAAGLAYVMYTSGSTGLPKGVAVTHGNLANYSFYIAGRLGLSDAAPMRFGVVSAISTDLGNTAIFPALIAGSSVHLIRAEASMEAGALIADLAGEPLDALKITPSHLRALLAGGQQEVLPRRWLITGGEALSWELVDRIRSLSPECRILNHYGPTETTIGCCTYDVPDVRREDAASVPIGFPIAGTRAYVLDRARQLLPPGVPGELCIAGAGVTAGYVGAGGDSDAKFSDDPFKPDDSGAARSSAAGSRAGSWPEGRMYRTGDCARVLRDGAIEFLGRVDDQVKIRGFRIEPGEIEAALVGHPAIRQAAVTAEHDDRGELRLIGYLVGSEELSSAALHEHLLSTLPEYMIPSAFLAVEALPFTPSGKIDRRALRGLAAIEAKREEDYVAPRDAVEEEIAGIWRELLGVERVGVFDDFFALGGHSLLATQAIMRIRRQHGDIPLRALLAAPTVAALADVVRGSTSD